MNPLIALVLFLAGFLTGAIVVVAIEIDGIAQAVRR